MRPRPRLLSDLSPLRESRQYRLLYLGELFALFGSQLTVVAVPLQVYLLTRSSLAVGLVGLAQLGPLLACSLVGGAVAALAGPQFSVVSGGLACLAGVALIAWRMPELDRTVMEHTPPA